MHFIVRILPIANCTAYIIYMLYLLARVQAVIIIKSSNNKCHAGHTYLFRYFIFIKLKCENYVGWICLQHIKLFNFICRSIKPIAKLLDIMPGNTCKNVARHPEHNIVSWYNLEQWLMKPWWRRRMETFSALPVLCEWNPPVTGGFSLTKASDAELWYFRWFRLNKQSRCQLF